MGRWRSRLMYFDRFDICEAYYVFAMLWHGGQWSEEYRIFGRLDGLGFKPRPMLSGPEDLGENGREIYENILRNRGL
jgi:hypothetical protein